MRSMLVSSRCAARLAGVGFVLSLLTACTSSTSGPSASGDPSSVQSSAGVTAGASATPSPSQASASDASRTPSPSPTATGGVAPTVKVRTKAPVKPTETARAGRGVAVTLRSWSSTTLPAGAPGEIGGPGVALKIRVVNDSKRTINVNNVVVDLRYGKDDTPALRADRSPTKPFSGELAPGERATATYAFGLKKAERSRVTVIVRLDGVTPVVVFKGSLNS